MSRVFWKVTQLNADVIFQINSSSGVYELYTYVNKFAV